ncbi:MAG TPA: hypothetical protein VM265_07965 [Sphingomicrobium sp.]|nr:hypothetical protein [Sphingomicrobium sp.]
MAYVNESGGRVDDQGFQCRKGAVPPGFWTFEAVEERLVEAMRLWRRAPDIEARFSLGGRISSIWRSYCADRRDLAAWGALIDVEAEAPRRLPLGRAEIGRMTEASDWIAFVPDRDRPLVMAVLTALARGARAFPWESYWRSLGRGRPGPDGLRWRYSQAITKVANALNRRKSA